MKQNKQKKSKSSETDIEKGTIIIVEPLKKTPIDSIRALENEIMRSLMPIPKGKASKYFDQGNPLEREQKGMMKEDIESYAFEINNPAKFNLGRGIKRTKKRRHSNKRHKTNKRRKTNKRH